RYNRALAAVQEADVLARASQPLHLEAYTTDYRGQLLYRQGLLEAARQQLEQALALARTAGVQDLEAQSLWHLGRVALALAAYPQAQDYCARALYLYHALGDRVGDAAVRCEPGTMAYEQSRIAEAHTCFDASVRMQRMLRSRAGEGGR